VVVCLLCKGQVNGNLEPLVRCQQCGAVYHLHHWQEYSRQQGQTNCANCQQELP
jgi:hypothetical protein